MRGGSTHRAVIFRTFVFLLGGRNPRFVLFTKKTLLITVKKYRLFLEMEGGFFTRCDSGVFRLPIPPGQTRNSQRGPTGGHGSSRMPTEAKNSPFPTRFRLFPRISAVGLWVAVPGPLTSAPRNPTEGHGSPRNLIIAQSPLDSDYFQ